MGLDGLAVPHSEHGELILSISHSLPKPFYQDKLITLYNNRWEDVLPHLTPGTIDLGITSPPYNLKAGHEGMRKGNKGSRLANGYEGVYDDALPQDQYEAWQREGLLLVWSLLAEHGAIYYNHKPRVLDGLLWTPDSILRDWAQCGQMVIPMRQLVIWDRMNGVNLGDGFYVNQHEWIMVLVKSEWRLVNRGDSAIGDVWRIPSRGHLDRHWSLAKQGRVDWHPTPWPEALPTRAIVTTDAHAILDWHAGSGTTLVAAKALGRRAIGIEMGVEYCRRIVDRLTETTEGTFARYQQSTLALELS
jgi:site-specific DNA-methyltransferase (adenine-specific)